MQQQLRGRAFQAAGRHGGLLAPQAIRRTRPLQATATQAPNIADPVKLEALRLALDAFKIEVGTDKLRGGRSALVAAQDISAGEPLIQVPDSKWLSAETIKRHPLSKVVADLEPWLQVALVLVYARFGPSNTEWSTYAQSLPADLSSPLFWSEQELSLIEGTQMLQSVRSYNSFFNSKFAELQQGLFAANPSEFPPLVFTLEHFLWAVVTVRARVREPLEGDRLALVPLADAVSHSRNANVTLQVKAAGLFGRGQVAVVEASRGIKKGEALALDFGPSRVDGELLLDYGVLDTANSQGGYSLCLTMPEEDRNLDDKLDILSLAGFAQSSSFALKANVDPSPDMMAFLRLMQLQGADTFLLESIFRAEAWNHMSQPVAIDNERAVCRSMAEGAREALALYPTSIEADLARLRSGQVVKGSREEAALMIRLGEKEALDSLLRYFEQREALLPTLEYYQERRLKRLGLLDDKGNTTYDGFFDKGIA